MLLDRHHRRHGLDQAGNLGQHVDFHGAVLRNNGGSCQRRSKSRPLGGAKVVHLAAHLGNAGRA
ncbi:MAG: hypothetical protein DCC69_06785 [Hyphomicrobiales bacterium]|nr:MAG: hypothetical protein DCC69_06785 [Hyphomicrobiales bacterium]